MNSLHVDSFIMSLFDMGSISISLWRGSREGGSECSPASMITRKSNSSVRIRAALATSAYLSPGFKACAGMTSEHVCAHKRDDREREHPSSAQRSDNDRSR